MVQHLIVAMDHNITSSNTCKQSFCEAQSTYFFLNCGVLAVLQPVTAKEILQSFQTNYHQSSTANVNTIHYKPTQTSSFLEESFSRIYLFPIQKKCTFFVKMQKMKGVQNVHFVYGYKYLTCSNKRCSLQLHFVYYSNILLCHSHLAISVLELTNAC